MPNVTITGLPDATTPLVGTERVPMDQSGTTKDATTADIAALARTNSANSAVSAPAQTFTGTFFSGGTATTTKPHLLIEPTGTTSTGWSTSGTALGVNAASVFAGNLLDLQKNGTSIFAFGADGSLMFGAFPSPTIRFANNSVIAVGAFNSFLFGGARFTLSADSVLSWSNTSNNSNAATDLLVARDTTDVLAQRRTTNAQTFRCYGTYTDASNYVRVALSSTSTAVTLAAETAGTGADNVPVNITAAGTGTVKVNSVAEVAVSSTVAGLPTSPAVGMLTRVTDATAPAVGSIVSGGGAAAALVWYNGTSWTVIGV